MAKTFFAAHALSAQVRWGAKVVFSSLCVNFLKYKKKGLPRGREVGRMCDREFARWCTGAPKITGVGASEKTRQH